MAMLVLGVLIWAGVHLFSSLAPQRRAAIIARLGKNRYKGIYSLLLLASLVLIVLGWRESSFVSVYQPPTWGRDLAIVLMLPAFLLIVSSDVPRNHLRRWLRHPMLLGATLWSIAHLLANGDARSIVLFGGIGLWALLEIVLINRRDGPRAEVPPASAVMTAVWLAAGTAVYLLLGWLHRWFAGVPVLF